MSVGVSQKILHQALQARVSDTVAGACVRFLAGNEARWITGAIFPVDAGATAGVGVGQHLGH